MAKFEALKLATENHDSKPVLFGISVKCYMTILRNLRESNHQR